MMPAETYLGEWSVEAARVFIVRASAGAAEAVMGIKLASNCWA